MKSVWRAHFPPDSSSRARRTHESQRSQACQVVRRHGQRKQLIDFLQAAYHHLPDRPDPLAPAEALLDAFPFALAQRITEVSRRPAVNRTSAPALRTACDVRRHVVFATGLHKSTRVVRLVGAHRNPHVRTGYLAQHVRRHLAFRPAIRRAGLNVDDQPVPVVRQNMAQVAPRRLVQRAVVRLARQIEDPGVVGD